jgi:hypothetical protein
MSTLAKWNPFRDLEDIQNRLSPWFGRIALRGSGDVCAKDLTATPLRSGLFRSFAPWRPPGSLREAYLLASSPERLRVLFAARNHSVTPVQ